MTTKFAIFNCYGALELYEEFKESHGVYIPVERVRRVCPKTKAVTIKKYAAMSGLVFCPLFQAKEFRRRARASYRLKQLFFEHSMMPRTVELKDLVEMQVRLNKEFDGKAELFVSDLPTEGEIWFEVGECVDLSGCMLPGMKGTVERIKSDGTVRVGLSGGMQYLNVKKNLLAKCG